MMENIVVAVFPVESQVYQAFSKIKDGNTPMAGYFVSQMAIVQRTGFQLQTKDSYDTGIDTTNDTFAGGLLGALFGVLGGPVGILLGGSIGTLIGGSIDLDDANTNDTMIQKVSHTLANGETALVAFVQEQDDRYFDDMLHTFTDVTITRWDAAVLEQEIETARELEAEFERNTRKLLRKEKAQEHKAKIEERRTKIKDDFSKLKEKIHNKA